MFAAVQDTTVLNLYGSIPMTAQEGVIYLPVYDDIPSYDARYQTVIPPASPVNAQDRYTIAEDRVLRCFCVEDIPLLNLQAKRKLEVEAKRLLLLNSGYSFGGKMFSCIPEAKTNMMIQYLGFQAQQSLDPAYVFPVDFGWKAIGEDEVTPMDFLTFQQLVIGAGQYCSDLYTKSFAIKKEIEQLSTALDIINYTISFE
jgi:hypothetical protein